MQTISSKNIEVINTTKGELPSLPFVVLKEKILGKAYELSISFIDIKKMKELSIAYKGDDTHTNTLSFPLNKKSGEIIMNLTQIKKEAKSFNRSFEEHLLFIVIHGMLHLKGLTHGSRMESEEKRLMRVFGF